MRLCLQSNVSAFQYAVRIDTILDLSQKAMKQSRVFIQAVGPPGGARGKQPACQCKRDETWAQALVGKDLGGGRGSTLQCSCLANAKDRGAWRATVHRVTEIAA